MKRQLNIAGFLLATSVLASCSLLPGMKQDAPVARVMDHYLYTSDLEHVLPDGISKKDSATLASRYVDTWIRDQLMLQQAELALTEEQKDFERQIAEYRRSLLVFSYRQKLLQQKMDTLVPAAEIENYYTENLGNFILSGDVIRGSYMKLPKDAPRMDEVRRWSWNNGEEELDQMEKYCLSYAEKFSDFNESWIYFSSLSDQLPMTISRPSSYLRYNRNIETSDSLYRYMLHISDHLAEGETTPLELVEEDIRNIILNKRKIEFFQELDRSVYNEGVSKKQFELFK